MTLGTAPPVYRPLLNLLGQRPETAVGIPPAPRIRIPVQQTRAVQRSATLTTTVVTATVPPAPSVRVGATDYSVDGLVDHLWNESHKEDASLVWHDEYRGAVAEFGSQNKTYTDEIDLTMALASWTMGHRAALVRGNDIAQALYDGGERVLAVEFARAFTANNPRIPLSLMVQLREKGWLKVKAVKYRESAGGQNGMIYYFQVAGFLTKNPKIGEWHVHWEAKRKPGSPGWKRGKYGAKTANTQTELGQLRSILDDLWGEVKSTGGAWV